MKKINKTAQSGTGSRAPGTGYRPTLDEVLLDNLVIDTRSADEFAAGHRPGTINIPLNGSFVTWAGWFIPYDRDFYVITDRSDDVKRALRLIGLDRVAGDFPAFSGRGGESIAQLSAQELAKRLPANGFALIDVRNDNEWAEGHIESATHIPLGRLPERIDEVPADKPIVVQCQSGQRSAIAASVLQKSGRKDVSNLTGGFAAWQSAVKG
jgi:hydroxyacylglutathione hydrolase